MTPRDIIRKVRVSPVIRDVNEARYSDYDMLDALNTVLNYVYNELGTFSNDLLVKTETIDLFHGEGSLPDDFLQAVEVYHGNTVYMPCTKGVEISPYMYSIMGNNIYANTSSLTIDYKPQFEELTMDELDDDMYLPLYMKELLKQLVIMDLNGNLETPDGVAYMKERVREITAGRGYNRLELHGAWSEVL